MRICLHALRKAAWIAGVVFGSSSASAQPVPIEVQVTRSFIADLEFDWGRDGTYCATCNFGAGNARFAFTDFNNILWVGNIDPDTGNFVQSNGHGMMAGTDAAQADDFGNGPEWVNGPQGSQITYMKYLPGMPHVPANAGVAVASFDGAAWGGDFIVNGVGRYLPTGSLDVGDPNPRLVYQNRTGSRFKAYARYLDDPGSEIVLPGNKPVCSRRWVPATQALIYTAPCLARDSSTHPAQVYWYDFPTRTLEQVTFDAGVKLYALAWRAPEFGNDYVLATVADRTAIVIYRRSVDGGGSATWIRVNTIPAPPATPYVTSPEVFVHNGKSYVIYQLSSSLQATDFRIPTHIAITGIDPALPSVRMLTNDDTVLRVRQDPEYYITNQGPFIYYNRYVPATETSGIELEGIWRVDTGLGPAVAQ